MEGRDSPPVGAAVGFTGIGATVAVGLWLFLLHVRVLVGYALTRRIDERDVVPRRMAG